MKMGSCAYLCTDLITVVLIANGSRKFDVTITTSFLYTSLFSLENLGSSKNKVYFKISDSQSVHHIRTIPYRNLAKKGARTIGQMS